MIESSRPLNSAFKKRGQAAVEYILLLALVVGVFVGIFLPIITKKTQGMQATLRDRASGVLAQDQLGIPLQWFGLEGSGDLARLESALGPGAGSSAKSSGAGGAADSGGKDKSKGKKSGGQDSGDSAGGSSSTSGSNSKSTASSSASSASSTSGADGEGQAEAQDSIKRGRRGGGGGDGSSSSTTQDGKKNGGGGQTQAGADPNAPPPEGDATKKGAPKFQNRDNQSESGGCRGFDAFLILKIVAIAGILILLGGMLFSGKGGKEGG